jgi:hypothetical protein
MVGRIVRTTITEGGCGFLLKVAARLRNPARIARRIYAQIISADLVTTSLSEVVIREDYEDLKDHHANMPQGLINTRQKIRLGDHILASVNNGMPFLFGSVSIHPISQLFSLILHEFSLSNR